ncbi:potassium transporter [Mycena albidolilacea]|uniref:Potassium transporter n=1 Tax=Mycena albidolilacea TaxID=1033008 RepID=A0AAD7EIW9_9AGAR|nr:potassium transporter [Mycena albidolilacea]
MAEERETRKGILARLSDLVWTHGTFYRFHVVAFTIVPLIAAGIFYGCNGRFHVSFLDSMFICYSAMTVTGCLTTINLSTTTPWQQAILYILMIIGDFTVVSWIVSFLSLWYFKNVCEYIDHQFRPRPSKSRTLFLKSISAPVAMFKQREEVPAPEKFEPPTFQLIQPTPGVTLDTYGNDIPNGQRASEDEGHILSDARTFSSSPRAASIPLSPTATRSPQAENFGVTTSIDRPPRLQTVRGTSPSQPGNSLSPPKEGVAFPRRTATIYSSNRKVDPENKKFEGKGGFPGPLTLAKALLKRGAPTTYRKLERKMTMPYTETLTATQVPWISFDGLVIGRNSAFRTETLSDDQLEFIGGVEYRALRLLSYAIPLYFVGTQLLAFLILAPWLSSTTHYDAVFTAQPKLVQKPWYSMFIVLGAYSGGGLSLVDTGMVPFQGAYAMIFALMLVILAGNHALVRMHRLTDWPLSRWTWYKIVGKESETGKTLSFLLQHPRRYVNRFPSHQTWFLFIALVGFSTVEWIAFEVLDRGLPFFEEMAKGPRIVDGLFQGLAARASGLAIVPVASASPALQFLYVVMMYIAIYPVAMTIRSTNVYESESLGVFEEPPAEEDEEPADLDKFEPRERIGRYLKWHLDRQMSIDIWWLVWGVFLVAVIERHNLLDEDKKWFDLFRIVFELVSAFGGIGLSLGLPTVSSGFSGALRPLSKLVIIVIMVRGRHRGLPVGVERAVTLPRELNLRPDGKKEEGPGANGNGTPAAPA